jgi:TRAP-type mannitol/chloroaromatic compound transport system permease small subunit
MLLRIERLIDRFADAIGALCAALMVLMMLNVFYDAIARYFFRTGSIAMQEMEWHLFSVIFLFGMSYTLKEDAHVRVDVLYDRWSPKVKAVINIAGTFLLLVPISLLIVEGSFGFVREAWETGEISGDPGGLAYRWVIKTVIPVAFVFLLVTAVGFVLRNVNVYLGREEARKSSAKDELI